MVIDEQCAWVAWLIGHLGRLIEHLLPLMSLLDGLQIYGVGDNDATSGGGVGRVGCDEPPELADEDHQCAHQPLRFGGGGGEGRGEKEEGGNDEEEAH